MRTPYIQKIKRLDRPTPTDLRKVVRWIWMDEYGKMLHDIDIDSRDIKAEIMYNKDTQAAHVTMDVEIKFIGYRIECDLVNDDRHTFIQNVVIAKTHGIRRWKYVGD